MPDYRARNKSGEVLDTIECESRESSIEWAHNTHSDDLADVQEHKSEDEWVTVWASDDSSAID